MKQVQTKLFNYIIQKKLMRLKAEAEPKNLSGRALYVGQNFASAGRMQKNTASAWASGFSLGLEQWPRLTSLETAANVDL